MDSEVLTKYCKDKQVPEQVRGYLSSLIESDLREVLGLIQTLSPSSNSLRTIVELLRDIQHRDKLTFFQILENVSLHSVLSSGGSSKDKQLKLKNSLMQVRYPEKFSIENNLNRLSAEIRQEFGFKIILPEELEGDQMQIDIVFRTCENLSATSEKLGKLSESKKLQEMFSILKGEI